ncbi:MAG: aminodeoxychorismate synthase component I [Candidatus Omnitrophica bacterium]|nr:aminodeoxychorismate synthase component I [Candidatus Omnitrophota bacterium]
MAYYILKSYRLKLDPSVLFEKFCRYPSPFFLDSGIKKQNCSRYSFLGIEPFLKLKLKNNGDPFKRLAEEFKKYCLRPPRGAPPFIGGAVGYLGYDSDWVFHFYNTVVAFDHLKRRVIICCTGFPEKNPALAKVLAKSNLGKIEKMVLEAADSKKKRGSLFKAGQASRLESNFSKQDYLAAVKKAKEYIRIGDIYQVNLSQRFSSSTNLSAAEIYLRLRKTSPAPFAAYFDAGSHQVLSSSPERFLKLGQGKVITIPMKGTRPRSPDRKEDTALKEQLLNSAKDKAELTMIVDLERNDLGRVCDYDSIKVTRLRQLEAYRTVYQTTATIEGKLFAHCGRFDLLRACFPGGSITGCPKIRAMEIIRELEPDKRQAYTGALGYLSFCGRMDFNILIRTILKKGKRIYFWAGGGIVADSRPLEEYQETLVKAKGMIGAIYGA